MIRRNRDSKFVIYQILYIFVITVLALKGAEIDLGEVVSKDAVVNKSVRDSLVAVVDSLTDRGLKFNIEIDPNVVEENADLKKKLIKLNTQVASLSNKIKNIPVLDKPLTTKKEKVRSALPSPFSQAQTFLQFATNYAENKGDYPVRIFNPEDLKNPIVTIPPNENKEFELSNEKELIVQFGYQEEIAKVKENLPPDVNITKVTTKMDGSDIYVRELQKTTCFTVKIADERVNQLKIKYSGPISVTKPTKDNKGNLIYNVSLKLASNSDRFDEWVDRNKNLIDKDGRYKANFFFTIVDTKSKQTVQIGESFYFTDFAN